MSQEEKIPEEVQDKIRTAKVRAVEFAEFVGQSVPQEVIDYFYATPPERGISQKTWDGLYVGIWQEVLIANSDCTYPENGQCKHGLCRCQETEL